MQNKKIKISEIHNSIIKKEISIEQLIKDSLLKLDKIKPTNASLLEIKKESITIAKKLDKNLMENLDSLLYGIPYSLKDNFSTKGFVTTGGSKFLENYVPPYNSYVKDLLDNQNSIMISKANLDEFGLGGTGTFSAFGLVKNPVNEKSITGGSSSGSAVMVQQGVVPFSIGTDTGDSVRKPANYLGVVGYKPSYGLISRYGVYPYSPSLDHVGILCNYVEDAAIVLNSLAKHDKNDFTSINSTTDFYNNLKPTNSYKMVVIKELEKYMDSKVKEKFNNTIKTLKENGFKIKEVSFNEKLIEAIAPIYKIISYAEASSCYANLTGIPFGKKENGKNYIEIAHKSRTKYFGNQLKRRFIIGAYATSTENFEKLFVKAKKIRTLIIEESNKIFSKADMVLMPGASNIAPLVEDIIKGKDNSNACDDALQIANFGGFPSITIPAHLINNHPIGLNIWSKFKNDLNLLNCAQFIENILNSNGGKTYE